MLVDQCGQLLLAPFASHSIILLVACGCNAAHAVVEFFSSAEVAAPRAALNMLPAVLCSFFCILQVLQFVTRLCIAFIKACKMAGLGRIHLFNKARVACCRR